MIQEPKLLLLFPNEEKIVTYCMSKHVILNKKVSWIIFLSCSCDELWKCKEMTKKDKLTSSFKEKR